MKILINGDSNMCGTELVNKSESINSHLCKLLDGDEINLAIPGASNDRIYNTTIEYLCNNPAPDLIVIGWSEFSRVQWFLPEMLLNSTSSHEAKTGGFVEINNLGVNAWEYQMPDEFTCRKNHWQSVFSDYRNTTILGYYWHERIYNLHKILEYKRVPHIFFHAFTDFNIHTLENKLNWNDRFMNPYDHKEPYIKWAELNGYKQITPGWFHFEPACQMMWANRLYEYINQHNLLKF